MVGHDHSHSHGAGAARAGARHAGRLKVAFVLIVAFLVVQVVVGLATNSLALLSDAGHMATDALGLGMALAAIAAANRQDHPDHRTFGLYRLEILAALANAVLLFAVAAYVLIEAVLRLADSGRAENTRLHTQSTVLWLFVLLSVKNQWSNLIGHTTLRIPNMS